MITVLQRVREAAVRVDGEVIGQIGQGLLVLLCAEQGDTAAGGGGLLVVSQFTLAADVTGGNRPSFTQAAKPDEGRCLYEHFVAQARAAHPLVQTGQFAADMKVALVNDGPVTIPIRLTA